MRVTLLIGWLFLKAAATARAHGDHVPAADDPRVFSPWDQATLLALTGLAALYWLGASRLTHVARHTRELRIEHASFAAGWLTLVIAVLPVFDRAVIQRFSAHMAQHELMILVAAPLLVAGRPLSRWVWALPPAWRHAGVAPLQHWLTVGTTRSLTAPAIAWGLHGAALWVWHVPILYTLAVQSEPVHALQHATFVGTSLLFWSGLIYGRYGRAGYGAAVFFVFTTAAHTGILGALLTVARRPMYAAYTAVPGVTIDAALADQQLAGLVMWIPAGLLFTLVGIALFAAWLGEAERRSRTAGFHA
jgi:putative membrane protein